MKQFIKYLFATSLVLSLFSCDDEDGFYNEKYVDTTQLVTIDGDSEFHAGENLYVGSSIPRYISEPGFSDLLDIYGTTGGATAFTFSYILEKQDIDGEWIFVDFTDVSIDVQEGSAENGSFILAHAEYSQTTDEYNYYGGIPLASAGEYRLSFGVNSDSTNEVEFRSESSGNNINLNLISDMAGLDANGYYHFTVLP
ncbi:hypothetical protein [Flavobacterium silvaticum]|uniref:Uncharacterized protein n=1 Tax=Flavobacterium silvaticum TaxID=1852020 RepID=A0A972FMY7_9FLAO|nr:hypothetical protein [Flavobacterium silvaticum]NMH29019.1 hypothetical protein [Flavobacterium silvaticum]